MRYVLDASVSLKWVLAEADSAQAIQVRDDFKARIHELIAPDIWPVESAHGLTKAERRGVIPIGDAAKLLAKVVLTRPRLHSHLPLLTRAVEISSLTRHGVYDCLYVALAEREGCELLTADAKLIGKLQGAFPFIRPLASLP